MCRMLGMFLVVNVMSFGDVVPKCQDLPTWNVANDLQGEMRVTRVKREAIFVR